MRKKTLYSQQGRSMIEVIGLLTISSALLIASVKSINYFLNNYRATQVDTDISRRMAQLLSQTERGNHVVSLKNFEDDSDKSYTFINNYGVTEDGLCYLHLSGVNEQVCKIIYKKKINFTEYIIINGKKNDENACSNSNIMGFFFKHTSSHYHSRDTSDIDTLSVDDNNTSKCDTGTIDKPSCPSGSLEAVVGYSDTGEPCWGCQNDECPTDTFQSCPENSTAVLITHTDYGSACYTCNQ